MLEKFNTLGVKYVRLWVKDSLMIISGCTELTDGNNDDDDDDDADDADDDDGDRNGGGDGGGGGGGE